MAVIDAATATTTLVHLSGAALVGGLDSVLTAEA
jgi:hypothetical protein